MSNDVPSDNAEGAQRPSGHASRSGGFAAHVSRMRASHLADAAAHTGTGHVDMYAKLLTPTDILVIEMGGSDNNDHQAESVIEDNVRHPAQRNQPAGRAVPEPPRHQFFRRLDLDLSNLHECNHPQPRRDGAQHTPCRPTIPMRSRCTKTSWGPTTPSWAWIRSDIVAMGGAVHCTTMQLASACGDGVIQDLLFEECDSQDLGGESCVTLGFFRRLVGMWSGLQVWMPRAARTSQSLRPKRARMQSPTQGRMRWSRMRGPTLRPTQGSMMQAPVRMLMPMRARSALRTAQKSRMTVGARADRRRLVHHLPRGCSCCSVGLRGFAGEVNQYVTGSSATLHRYRCTGWIRRSTSLLHLNKDRCWLLCVDGQVTQSNPFQSHEHSVSP